MGNIARAIGVALRTRGLAATVARPEDVRAVDRYDAVVIGSAVYAGHWMKQARKLVARTAPALAGRPVWLFSSGPAALPDEVAEIGTVTGAREHHTFTRTLPARSLRFSARPMNSDTDGNGDAPAISAWANEIADALTSFAAA
jgi:menaquinone-dependent protoporphyrinogen oxidase